MSTTMARDELVAFCGGSICSGGEEGVCMGHVRDEIAPPAPSVTMEAVIALESLEELHTAFAVLATRYMDATLTRDEQARTLEARVQRLEDAITYAVSGGEHKGWGWMAEELMKALDADRETGSRRTP